MKMVVVHTIIKNSIWCYLYKYSTRAVSITSNALPGHHDHHRCGQGYCLLIAHQGTFFEEIPLVPIFV